MERKDPSLTIMLGGTIGVIGLLIAFSFPKVGVPFVLIGLAVVFGPILIKQARAPRVKSAPRNQMIIQVPEQNQREMISFISSTQPPIPGHASRELSLIIRTLRQANLDPRAPVMVGNKDDEVLLWMQEVLHEVVEQASRYNVTADKLASNATKIYERIFENVEAACKAEPANLDGACIWLANRSLKDAFPELEKLAVKPASKPNRFDLE